MTVDSLDEDLAREFQAMAAEVDPHAAGRVTDAVVAVTEAHRPAWRRPRVIALGAAGPAAAATATVVVSLGWDDGAGHGRRPQNAACASAVVYAGNTYLFLTGPQVGTVDPGLPLGDATIPPCSDGAPDIPGDDTRPVYEMPDVPPEQALLVVDSQNRGTVFVNVEEPVGGWDPDLQAVFDRWDVDR